MTDSYKFIVNIINCLFLIMAKEKSILRINIKSYLMELITLVAAKVGYTEENVGILTK